MLLIVHDMAKLEEKIPRELGKTFGKPLVVVAFPPDAVAPPLVGTLVRAEEIRQLRSVLQPDLMPLCRIEKRGGPQVNHAWPTLTIRITNGRLLTARCL